MREIAIGMAIWVFISLIFKPRVKVEGFLGIGLLFLIAYGFGSIVLLAVHGVTE